ncbi:uncharacterized protein KY384_000432 [Bacidia gigantensis]|uniref:uncharacterized protein n=1 Tax=Bacidia gigantensis TaxID=2732470 RepID=UPI001D04C06D|nr:uncharacterized protein KY384_000432 [Bacidia gigantensis]KAG8525672.1 hypothetical protein KY384_000432 [Bacidia gigantensis]
MANAPSWPFAPFDSNYAPPQDPDTSTDYESAGAWAVASPFPSSANQIDHSNIVFDHPASFSTPFSPFPALAANDLGDLASEPAAVDLPSTGHDYTDLPGLEAAGHTIDPFLLAQPDYGTGGFTSDSEAHVDPGFAGASAAYRQPDQGDGGRLTPKGMRTAKTLF